MRLHLLITKEMMDTKPRTTEIDHEWGELSVVFGDRTVTGLHCFVSDTQNNLTNWLKPFDGVPVGNGSPMMESFTIMHIK